MIIIWAAARWVHFKIGALWMAGWIGGSSVIGTSSNSYSMGITGVWYVGAIAVGCVIFALVMARARQARERSAAEHHVPGADPRAL